MLSRLGLHRPQLATKLYGAIALILAVVYALAGATIQYASQTGDAVERLKEEGLGTLAAAARIEVLSEQQRRLVAAAPSAAQAGTLEQSAESYKQLGARIIEQLQRLGYPPEHRLAESAAALARQGEAVLDAARTSGREPTAAAAERYAAAADAFAAALADERQQRVRQAAEDLDGVAAASRSLITWVCAAAALTGVLIAPLGLFFLNRLLARLQGIGAALLRLARNDTSVDIPGLGDRDEIGQLARSVAVFKSKSIELLQKKGEFERLNLQLDAAINNMPLGLSMFDAQERLLVCNRHYAEMYRLPDELTRPGTFRSALWNHRAKLGARHSETDMLNAQSALRGHPMTIEFGKERIIAVSRQPLKGGGWVALHEDITQRRRQEEEITHLARHDALTGLANRVLFREQLQQSLHRLVRGQGFAVLCLDLDHFKSVNDTLGHPVGDALLKEVSARLIRCVRQGDLVARLGGDEFAIIQTSAREAEQTETLAARIVETISKPYSIDGHRIDISTSIGMTFAPRDGTDPDQLMKNADLALYRTKSDGRKGYCFFQPEMNDEIQVRRTLEIDLRKAVSNEELELFYQPQVSLKTHKVTGFEALLRWHHPTRGNIPPMEFISIAEEIGLISEIGEWALRQACSQAMRWPAPLRVAINLSSLQFLKRNLMDTVLQSLAATGLSPERLELEITETILLQDSHNTIATLHRLRELGVHIAMDDFGTGYCSLSYLRSFPFDKIKIDRAFIADIDRSEEARAIVETIVGLGESLRMTTVAEGIETHEQLKLVRTAGCLEAQGYLFSPPVPACDIHRLLREEVVGIQHAA